MKTKVNPLNNNARSSFSLHMLFTLDAQQTLNLFEHSQVYRQAAGHLRTFLNRVRKPLFGAGECLHQPSFYSRTFANSVRKQCSAGVNAPLEEIVPFSRDTVYAVYWVSRLMFSERIVYCLMWQCLSVTMLRPAFLTQANSLIVYCTGHWCHPVA